MSEADLQKAVLDLAATLRYVRVHFRPAQLSSGRWVTPFAGDAGFPDTVIVGHGRVVFAELKNARHHLEPEQEVWRDQLIGAGQEWYLWRPADWLDGTIERVLRKPAGGDSVIGRLVQAAA